jgi:flavodoxin
MNEKSNGNVLVVYYSKTGNTKRMAEQIARGLSADIEEITDTKKRSGIMGFILGGRDAAKKKETEINEIKRNPSDYDLVVIGSPVWAGAMTPAVRTYLNKYKNDIKSLAFFASAGGSVPDKIFKDVENITGKEPTAITGVSRSELKSDDTFNAKISSFVESINKR